MGEHQGGPLYPLYDIGYRKGLPRARNPKQRLIFFIRLDALGQLVNCLGLVPCGLEFRYDFKFHGLKLQKYPGMPISKIAEIAD